jgi:hypothetical protein
MAPAFQENRPDMLALTLPLLGKFVGHLVRLLNVTISAKLTDVKMFPSAAFHAGFTPITSHLSTLCLTSLFSYA